MAVTQTHVALLQARFRIPGGELVNTFNFASNATIAQDEYETACRFAVADFYNQGTPSADASVGAHMATWVATDYEIRSYDWHEASPRTPTITDTAITGTRPADSKGTVPMEVAMCLSYACVPPVTRRRKGRIYIGGITSDEIVSGTSTVAPRFSQVGGRLLPALRTAAINLMNSGFGWSVWSRAGNEFNPIVSGYIDTEPDTQRRRGQDAFGGSARVEFP